MDLRALARQDIKQEPRLIVSGIWEAHGCQLRPRHVIGFVPKLLRSGAVVPKDKSAGRSCKLVLMVSSSKNE